jgi:hypothetical protein
MRKFLICIAVITFLTMIGGRAIAVPVYFGDGGTSLQGELDKITTSPNAGQSSTDVTKEALSDDMDSTWEIKGAGASVETVIVEVAEWAGDNTFGIYDKADPTKKVEIFAGRATTGSQALLSILANGSVIVNFVDTGVDFNANAFGYYLDSTESDKSGQGWTGGVWHSDTSLNVDGMDHMYAYQGKDIDHIEIPPYSAGIWSPGEYIFAFEDLHSDHWGNQNDINEGYPEWSDTEPDFSDFVVIVESVRPVPEPSAIFLIAGLVCVMLGLSRKKFMV